CFRAASCGSVHGVRSMGEKAAARKNKSEIRISKSETNSNTKIPMTEIDVWRFGFCISDFEFVSDFEIRISDFFLADPIRNDKRGPVLPRKQPVGGVVAADR